MHLAHPAQLEPKHRAAPLSHSVVPAAAPESDTPHATRQRGARERRGTERGAARGAGRGRTLPPTTPRGTFRPRRSCSSTSAASRRHRSLRRGASLSAAKVKTQPCKQVWPPQRTPPCRGRGCAERGTDRSRAARGAQRRGSERASPTSSPTPAPLVSSATPQTCCLHHTAATRTALPAAVSSASRGRSARARQQSVRRAAACACSDAGTRALVHAPQSREFDPEQTD